LGQKTPSKTISYFFLIPKIASLSNTQFMLPKLPFILLLGLLAPAFASAQITLDANDVPPFGAVLVTKTDTLPFDLTAGAAGEAVTWDFSMLADGPITTNTVVDPAVTPAAALFPQASFAFVSATDFYSYAQVTNDGLFALGGSAQVPGGEEVLTVVLNPAQQLLAVPTSFGTSFSNTYGLRAELDGSLINPLLDSIRLVQTSFQEARVDAYGTLILPDGTHEVLRQRVETYSEDSIFVKFFGVWSLFDVAQDTSLQYDWWAAEGRGQVLTLDVDAEGNVFSATYLSSYTTGTIAAPVAAFSAEIIGEGEVAFTDASTNSPTQWLWDFGDGSTSEEQSPVHTYEASGEYEVCLTASNAGGENTTCQEISVMVTSTRQARMVEGLRAYPSPVADRLYLEFGTLAGQPVQLHLINTLGQNFGTYRLDFAPAEPWGLDVAALPPGLYRLAVASGNRYAQTLTFLRQP
jgi:hypothetical protein